MRTPSEIVSIIVLAGIIVCYRRGGNILNTALTLSGLAWADRGIRQIRLRVSMSVYFGELGL